MKKIIELIKRIFFNRKLALNQPSSLVDEKTVEQKENFKNSIKAENHEESILLIQKKLENGIIDESKLTSKQLAEIRDLYYHQTLDLINSIKNYKLKLN